ncbi:MAG: C-terminal binding protein [Christensenella sp.]|nr:C-terminal binding protein [Christensenella sp.]
MTKKMIAISDCDHLYMTEEQTVCDQYGVGYTLFQCKTEDDLIAQLQGYEAVVNQYAPFTERVFAALPELKMIARYGVGVNNIDLAAATRHHVAICNVPDYGVQEVASHALALMMALTRKIVRMDASVKRGEWEYARSIPIRRFSEMTFGVVGLGRIGSCFAELLRPFGGRILGYEIDPQRALPDFVEAVDFETLVRESDVISLHCNLETSRNLINLDVMRRMKPEAVLVNVSRGGIVNEFDLAVALNDGLIAGAGIDVTMHEPLEHDSLLMTARNLILTPHMAWYSEEASSSLKTKTAEEAARFLTGKPLLNQLNRF